MGFWFYMLAMDLLIPLVMVLFGRRFRRRPPKNINSFYGYRTAMSMKNQDTWRFAHAYCGRLWFRWGLILLPVTAAVMLPFWGKDIDTVGLAGGAVCLAQLIPLVGALIPTERALRHL